MVKKLYNQKKIQSILLIIFTFMCFTMWADTITNETLNENKIVKINYKETIVRYKYISVVDHKEAFIDVIIPKIVN